MKTNRFDIQRMTRSNTGVGGGATGGGGGYTLPLAADGVRGGVQVGFTTDATARKYAVQLDNEKAYVNVPWTDHYAWADITGKPDSFTPSAHTHAWGDITSGVPATATRWPSWSEVTSKPTSKTAWGQTYLNSSSEFQNISGDLNAGSSGGTISQFHSIELNSAGSLSGYGGFIDFHFNGSSSDYTSRIIEDASGKLNLNQAVFVNYNGYVGIGDQNPAYKLEVAGNCRISSKLLVATTSSTYELNVGGKIYCTGGFAFLSDKRMKNVIDRQVQLTVDQIADAPLIYYTLKGDADKRVQLGSVAQYWKTVLPETVQTDEAGTLSMQYDVQAHTAVVVLARKVRALWEEVEKIKKQANG